MLVINKPAGMVVHPAPGNWSGTFVHALLGHCGSLLDQDSLRPGIVHRLDKETSGLLIAAKERQTQQRLIEMFASRSIEKEYLAIVIGNPGKGKVTLPIGRHPIHRQKMCIQEGGRASLTYFETLSSSQNLSLVRVGLETGRTHQIRVHMQALKTPVLGDPLYGIASKNEALQANRQQLHAHFLKFVHPLTNQSLSFRVPPPLDMEKFIRKYFSGNCLEMYQ